MSESIKHVTDTTFEAEVLASPVPVLVDYWAGWCGPCKVIAPILDDTAASYAGQISVAKIDVDANPKTPGRYHIRSLPTLMLFRNGQPVAMKVGALNKSQLTAFIEDHLNA
jgi:thioredoxin 1